MVSQRSKADSAAWLRTVSGELSSTVLRRLEETLPWFAAMPPGRRSAVGMVAQSGITQFIDAFENPESTAWSGMTVFNAAPRELLRSISLTQTLQLIRVVVEVVEQRVADEDTLIREGILRYSREIAFAAADIYARAAEARGLWDERLEALVVDSILTGEHDDELASRVAALGWSDRGAAAVLVGTTPKSVETDQIRRVARRNHMDVLIGVHGSRLVVIMGRWTGSTSEATSNNEQAFLEMAANLDSSFGPGRLVLGPTVPSVVHASKSARAALAGFAVAGAVRMSARPMLADDLLPERALAGDPLARKTLIQRIYRPLAEHSGDLLATLSAYLSHGRALEATARDLYVHPNTVRYRLKRVSEILGWDATQPREAFTLQCALILGQLADPAREDEQALASVVAVNQREASRGRAAYAG